MCRKTEEWGKEKKEKTEKADWEAINEFTQVIKFIMALGSLLWKRPVIQAIRKGEVQKERECHASDIAEYMKDSIRGQVLIVVSISWL